jgi:hypothetical protein
VSDALKDLRRVFEDAVPWINSLGINVITAGPVPGMSWGPIASFPFRTQAALAVWAEAKRLIDTYENSTVDEIIRMATIEAKVFSHDIATEDQRLLEMAVSWVLTSLRSQKTPI